MSFDIKAGHLTKEHRKVATIYLDGVGIALARMPIIDDIDIKLSSSFSV